MKNTSRLLPAAAGLACLLAAAAFGQPPGPAHYDKSKEKTVAGTVEAVTEVTGGRGGGGLHVTLTAESEKWEVFLGPQAYSRSIGLTLAKGDAITVTGSADAKQRTVVAREVRKGDKTYRLRDENGFPLWSGGPKK